MYWVGLSWFKSITSQNPPQSHSIHSNTHVISITEQALNCYGWFGVELKAGVDPKWGLDVPWHTLSQAYQDLT
jgi:hypothetical protein